MSEPVCWSCEEEKVTIPVMFPASPDHYAPLKRHWWCEDCADAWLGTDDPVTLTTTGVVELAGDRGYREVQA